MAMKKATRGKMAGAKTKSKAVNSRTATKRGPGGRPSMKKGGGKY